MHRLSRKICLFLLTITLAGFTAKGDVDADFSDLDLGANLYWNGSDYSGGFSSRAVRFNNTFTDWGGGYYSWGGFSYSRVNDTVTPGFENEYAVISGTGVGGSGIYAVAYDDGPWGDSAFITLPVPSAVEGFYVNNTTYAALSMQNGDGFAKKFGGVDGSDPDWFMLTITGLDDLGETTGTVDFYLADFRFNDDSEDYIITDWSWVCLTDLGENVKFIRFALSSSDGGDWGMNTPAYFALDNLTTLESYAPAAEQPGSTAVEMDSDSIVAWATGWTNYVVGANCDPNWQTPALALGPAVGDSFDICCLGEGGQITLTFDHPIQDGPGCDLAVFENGFADNFLEFAYVEVSSDGTNFHRFFNRSLTTQPVGAFGFVNPTDVTGLGKYRQGYGEPFDLATLAGRESLDISNIKYVRLLDVSGDGTYTDSVGHVIYDPYLATGSAGFDLDAVGILSNDFQEVYVEAITPEVSRGGFGAFRLTRKTWDTSNALDVHIILEGSAINGTDYELCPDVITIPYGSTTQEIVIAPYIDAPVAGDCRVILRVAANDKYQVEKHRERAIINIQDLLPVDAWKHGIASQTFNSLVPASGEYWNGSDNSGGFTLNGIHFKNTFTDWGGGYYSWGGFAYSSVNDSVTPGYENQYAVISGTGVGGAGTYVVAYDDGEFGNSDVITLPSPARVQGFYINNTTYAFLSMRDGDSFSRKFCAESNDWFKLTITGHDPSGNITGDTEFYLADFRFQDANQNYIITNWTWVCLTNLGSNVKTLTFDLSSSDNGDWGMNTPAYFAMDDFRLDPNSPAFDDTASWDGSGRANLMMYVLGRAPGAAYQPDLIPTTEGDFFDVIYQRRLSLDDAEVEAQFCTNLLGEATWSNEGVVETVLQSDGEIATIRARIPGSDSSNACYVRLRAWRK